MQEILDEELQQKGDVYETFFPTTHPVLITERLCDKHHPITSKAAQIGRVGIWSIEDYVREDGFQGEIQSPPEEPDNDSTMYGNINSKGEKIYHLPDDAYYELTNAEELFCSKEGAEQLGFSPLLDNLILHKNRA